MTRPNAMTRRGLVGCAGLVLAATVTAACSSAGSHPASAGQTPVSAASEAALANPNLDVGTPLNNKPAPDFKLTNEFGQQMSLSQFRGKVVLLGFEDSECTTVCPLTTQSMVLAKELLGKAGDSVQLLGVDANPDATAVSDVLAYSRAHAMVNQWDFLTGTASQLKAVWKSYDIEVQIDSGNIDHTPALYVIDQQGRLQKLYLTQMAYSSVTQSAQVLAAEIAGLLPGHPTVKNLGSLAKIPTQGPQDKVTLPIANTFTSGDNDWNWPAGNATSVQIGPGRPRLLVFFATWLSETSDLKTQLLGLNSYANAAFEHKLPALTVVDEAVTEPSAASAVSYLYAMPNLAYPVVLDKTGRVADGYGVQDQPWLVLVNAAGKVTWQHDGWIPESTLEAAVRSHT
jgi:cytochrome oxidase Cu insertion factor (SCO1/SenC/PrrC family)